MLIRAARSITKTKSVSGDAGSFILKTKLSKSTEKTGNATRIESSSRLNDSVLEGIDEGRPNRLRASFQQVPPGHLSPKYSDSN